MQAFQKQHKLTVGIDNWIFNLYFHWLWAICKKRENSAHISPFPRLTCHWIWNASILSTFLCISWCVFCTENIPETGSQWVNNALSSIVGIVAPAWVKNGCLMGGKKYHREVKYTKVQLCLLYSRTCSQSCILETEEEQQWWEVPKAPSA